MKIRSSRIYFLTCILEIICFNAFCQVVDSSSFKLLPRQSFYSYEREGEFLLTVPPSLSKSHLSVSIRIGDDNSFSWNGISGMNILRLPFSLDKKPAVYNVAASITVTKVPEKYISPDVI